MTHNTILHYEYVPSRKFSDERANNTLVLYLSLLDVDRDLHLALKKTSTSVAIFLKMKWFLNSCSSKVLRSKRQHSRSGIQPVRCLTRTLCSSDSRGIWRLWWVNHWSVSSLAWEVHGKQIKLSTYLTHPSKYLVNHNSTLLPISLTIGGFVRWRAEYVAMFEPQGVKPV